ncbi:UNVERIFIED_CONTAM: hypothetical protein FKN15_052060 [Acipenser sinensis]
MRVWRERNGRGDIRGFRENDRESGRQEVWGSDIQGRDCGDEASRWITRYLNNEKTFRLVQYELDMQPRRPHDTEKRFKPKDKIAYPDNSPIMLLSEASLEDLNTRVEKKVEMRNFRPSIVVTGCDAYAEEDGHKVTGRQEPRLVLITASSDDVYLYLNAAEMEELRVPLKLSRSNSLKDCRVWGSDIQGRDCGDEASRWITRYLNNEKTFRLVQYELDMQPRRPHDTEKRFKPKDKIAYPDNSPIMLLSEASLEDLNTRVEKKVEMRNFRPSIVVTGCDAYAELQKGTSKPHAIT